MKLIQTREHQSHAEHYQDLAQNISNEQDYIRATEEYSTYNALVRVLSDATSMPPAVFFQTLLQVLCHSEHMASVMIEPTYEGQQAAMKRLIADLEAWQDAKDNS